MNSRTPRCPHGFSREPLVPCFDCDQVSEQPGDAYEPEIEHDPRRTAVAEEFIEARARRRKQVAA